MGEYFFSFKRNTIFLSCEILQILYRQLWSHRIPSIVETISLEVFHKNTQSVIFSYIISAEFVTLNIRVIWN